MSFDTVQKKPKKGFGLSGSLMLFVGAAVTLLLALVIVVVAICSWGFMIFSSTFFNDHQKNLFGYRFYTVLTDSMSLSELNEDFPIHFDAGDIVIVAPVDDPAALQPGQVISFVSQSEESFGETVIHAIREVRKTKEGKVIGYVTYGTNTGTTDIAIVQPEYVLGTYWGHLPAVGHFFNFMKTSSGYTCFLLISGVVMLIAIALFVISIVLALAACAVMRIALISRPSPQLQESAVQAVQGNAVED